MMCQEKLSSVGKVKLHPKTMFAGSLLNTYLLFQQRPMVLLWQGGTVCTMHHSKSERRQERGKCSPSTKKGKKLINATLGRHKSQPNLAEIWRSPIEASP